MACLLLKEYLRLDYRTTREMLELSDGLRSALNLSRVPDHSTLWWFARHKLEPKLLQEALEETVRRFKHGLRRPAEENDTGGGPGLYWAISILQLALLSLASEAGPRTARLA